MKLNKKQQEAVLKSLEWYYCRSYDKPLFIISGVAGSGGLRPTKKNK